MKRSKSLPSPRRKPGAFLRSFPSFSDERSRILILGSMPGPVALKKSEYYGYPGNHFWKIMFDLFEGSAQDDVYKKKRALLKINRIALWDVIASCRRTGASDSSICEVSPNKIIELIRRRRNIRTIFLNGKTAEKLYRKYFDGVIQIPAFYFPSTSPAHASMSYENKLKAWSVIKPYLENRNPWC